MQQSFRFAYCFVYLTSAVTPPASVVRYFARICIRATGETVFRRATGFSRRPRTVSLRSAFKEGQIGIAPGRRCTDGIKATGATSFAWREVDRRASFIISRRLGGRTQVTRAGGSGGSSYRAEKPERAYAARPISGLVVPPCRQLLPRSNVLERSTLLICLRSNSGYPRVR